MFITNGGAADTYVTFALTEPGKGTRGISAFIVEKDTPGFIIGKRKKNGFARFQHNRINL